MQKNVAKAPKKAAEKQKPVAYVNYETAQKDSAGRGLIRSSKGFRIFDNEHTTLEEKALVALAEQQGGTAVVLMEMKIVLAQEKPESIDISGIKLAS